MKIVEYDNKYEEDVKDLLVELEEYIISIDKDNLDQIGKNYREEMIKFDLEEVNSNNGKSYLAVEDEKAIGLIMGYIVKYEKSDYLDYKCPKKGRISELIVSKNTRSKGIGRKLMNKMEEYFKSNECKYISVEVFSYNENGIRFYKNNNYHTRCIDMIKEIN